MDKVDKVPRIRFKGYNDAWKRRRVSELVVERNEQSPMSDAYPLMAFIANEGVAPKGSRYDRSSLVNDVENKLYKKTEYGDFIYSSNNLQTGSIGLNKFGNATISPVYSIFVMSNESDSDFIGRRFSQEDFVNEMIKWRQGVIYGQWRIHESDFLKLDVDVPCLSEQHAIGTFLDNVDNLITFHQRKYEKLVDVKKSLLEKMFPAKGERVPKIRFSGYSDDWNQCELWSITIWDKKFNEVEDYKQTRVIKYPYVLANEFNCMEDDFGTVRLLSTGTYVGYTTEEKAGDYLCEGEIVAIPWGGVPNVKYYNGKFVTADNRIATSYDTSVFSNKFIALWLQSNVTLLESMYRGAAIKHPSMCDVLDIEITYPKIQEQEKISNLLFSINDLITLHQHMLDKLNNVKKALSGKMFV